MQLCVVHIKKTGVRHLPRGGQMFRSGKLRYGRIQADHRNTGAHRRQSDEGMIDAAGRQGRHGAIRTKAPFGELGGDDLGPRQSRPRRSAYPGYWRRRRAGR